MSDLIKREDAMQVAFLYPFFADALMEEIKSIPSADRPQGEWIVTDEDGWANGTHAFICSECGNGYHLNIERVIGDWNFCPNCGAKMKGADDGRNAD